MIEDKPRWGTIFFALSCAVTAGLCYFFRFFPADGHPSLYGKILPATGLILSLSALLSGHFSYPRLHCVRVYFCAYGLGSVGALYFVLASTLFPITASAGPAPHGYADLLFGVALINLCGVAFFPMATRYRVLRSVTLSLIAVEAVALLVVRFGAGTPAWTGLLHPGRVSDPFSWVVPALSCAAAGLSLWKIRHDFFLGGIVAGCALLLLAGWGAPLLLAGSPVPFQVLVFTSVALYFSTGMVVHGFLRMEHRIAFDPLLKIYNRDYCSRIITEQANLNVAPPFAVAMIDIDHFKQVNDTYGHHAGDLVLHAVAQAVKRGGGPDSIACRYGGEELALFFPQRNTREAAEIGERIRAEIEKIKTPTGRKTIKVTVSIGVSHRESYGQSIVTVIQAADKALYAAKKGGRNQVRSQKTPAAAARK